MKTIVPALALALAFAFAGAHAAPPLTAIQTISPTIYRQNITYKGGPEVQLYQATFQADLAPMETGASVGVPGSDYPVVTAESATVYANGVPDASVQPAVVYWIRPASTGIESCGRIGIHIGGAARVIIVVQFSVSDRTKDVFGVMLNKIFFWIGDAKASTLLQGPKWYTGFGPAPATSPADSMWSMANVSVRTAIGKEPTILGINVSGPMRSGGYPILLRIAGPALSGYGVTNVLPDPVFVIYDKGGMKVNECAGGWDTSLTTAFAAVGAFPFIAGSTDCAKVVSLSPGSYTVVVKSASGASGTVLIETYREPLQVVPVTPF